MENLTEQEQAVIQLVMDKMDKSLEKFQKGYISHEKFNEQLTAEFTKFAAEHSADEVNDLKKQLDAMGLELKAIKEKGTGQKVWRSFRQQLKEHIGTKSLKDMILEGQAKFTLDIEEIGNVMKTVGTVTRPAGNAYIPVPYFDMEWGYQPLNPPIIRTVADVLPTALGRAVWIEGGAREGSAGTTSEGSAKTQADATPTAATMAAQKITAYWDFTEEALEDIPGFMMEMERELMDQINLLEDVQFITGDGNAPNLKGAGVYAKAYELTTIQVTTPGNYDALVAALTQIYSKNFVPNAIIMNPVDIANMKLDKDSQGAYLLPVLGMLMPDGATIDGVKVYANNNVSAGYVLVGDFSKYHIRDYKELTLRIGYVGTNFKANIMTAVAEKRVIAYVKGGHEYAFCYDAIADILTAITTS